ncbi:MAG: bifunctional [glutamate--ammonia ligase]-adenylyl-L-tyrosine phosphorylase/[glutamate--ammonia-ligase] adenylyltransferase [Azonexus sp.]|jgi:glutamate-ammonia-ligase adenylyltransferase|uniref:bifunctional [glutamate--ammonia ligase]-adenylyl-L-tyrosine phosphorylase/[glutamate--ammonia-ligase] adenylyltransferase n=1 Tax=Azonexus sp. TaxID=1872668 RepID=UPI00282EE156|nr:bifunctional [glutamate--ammonia ligase]-adenylyl-L-tyrosine phosphorylase/[glutamate--ammonia-ligase] adenylyltransferase [Azonexus sp.]MDR0777569.1 bifunctional [glutamate--ammonia ligase]-adenylyl-L-tyrosine phosphorylase/[glutamate--ammonia-ligase] adenylyltransferase [Azonexus sp.]
MTSLPDPRWQRALDHSRYLSNLLQTRPELGTELATVWQLPLSEDQLLAPLNATFTDDEAVKAGLRRLRQRAMAHIALRDLCGLASLDEVVESMTLLADVTTNFAVDHHHRRLAATYGEPLDHAGRPQRLLVIGMGKLGGRELNVSSDVDYIFIYPAEGETAGPKSIDNYDFFTRLGKRVIQALGDLTADGQVFRVDMRLRPNGDSGPLVCSLDALEHYFVTQGREWERYAWIKARVLNTGVNADGQAIGEWMEDLRKISRPFVFRKYLDFGAINAMRDLHAQIRREVARKDMADHVKLGPGGIREIEFIAQVFQLIRGGRDPALQIRPTLSVLRLLAERQLLPAENEAELRAAYVFLRRLEHRLQYVEDQQTHRLPDSPEARMLIAQSMDFPDWTAMMTVLDGHRQKVSRHFEAVFSDPEAGEHPLTGLWLGQLDEETAVEAFAKLGFRQPREAIDRLADLRATRRFLQLPSTNRERFDAVAPRLIEAAGATADPDTTLVRGLAFLENIARRGAYLALLQQYPLALRRVADMIGASNWAADYLNRYPLLLDELLDPRLYEIATDWASFRDALRRNLANHADDTEREMDILREMHHGQVFRLLAQDLAGLQTIERLSDHLTELADIIVQETLPLVWSKIKNRHRPQAKFAVIGYGKLGGKELGYASDLDLVYLYADDNPEAADHYTRLGQRLNSWLGSQTASGILFETDLRLRPNGESGLLVVSVEAFRDYQLHKAWVWEHQALTRARFCAGDPEIGQRFEDIRNEILRQPRDLDKLRHEVVAMRQKMLDAHASKSTTGFGLKHDPGGLIDVEFIVQYLVLGHAHQHPELTGNLGNIALLRIAGELGLIDPQAAKAAGNAYREYRRLQHARRLTATPKAPIPMDEVASHIAVVKALWSAVLGPHTDG